MIRILVVDDEPDVTDYLVDVLEFKGWQAITAQNGVEGVLRVLDGGVDAVLMDIRMPTLDGINALKIIRRIDPDLPVLMLTGQAGQSDIFEATQLGAFTCLMKPISVNKLIDAIQQALGLSDENLRS